MIVHKSIETLPAFKHAVITIGTFDGVHTGHQQLIKMMKETASVINGETVIITFYPHPRQVIASQQSQVFLLNTMNEKISLLEKFGIQHLVIVPFTEAFSHLTANEYIEQFLVNTFKPHTIIIGHDHRFGKSRAGNFNLLQQYAPTYNYTVKEIPGFMLEENTISSTKIREALTKGDFITTNNYLGYQYFFSGIVVEGNKIGRTIGYPTANLQVENDKKIIPGNGVYAVQVHATIKGNTINLKGMMNIGIRPTVEGTTRMIEVNIFNFDEDIYGETLTITIKKRLRNEQKFNGLTELKNQLAKDKIEAALIN
jgi:riboflavin kinase / FMN adenylyltransferase